MILDFIDNSPIEHEQSSWFWNRDTGSDDPDVLKQQNVCGTTMCIAGTQRWLEAGVDGLLELTKSPGQEEARQKAGTALGLDIDEYKWLFLSAATSTARKALEAIAEGDSKQFKSLMRGFF
jgi:hypothetical protein